MQELKSRFSIGLHWYLGGALLSLNSPQGFLWHHSSKYRVRSVITTRWKWKSKFSLWFSLTSWKGGPITSWWGWKSQLPTHTLWHFPGRRWCGVGYLVTAWSGWNSALIFSLLTMWVGEWSTDFPVVLTWSFLSCYFPPLLVFCLEITSFSRPFFPVPIVVGSSNTQAEIWNTTEISPEDSSLCHSFGSKVSSWSAFFSLPNSLSVL